MSRRTDAIVITRARIRQSLDLSAKVHAALFELALSHASNDLDDTATRLSDVDFMIDKLCKVVEQTRIAVSEEHGALRPTQAEDVAA